MTVRLKTNFVALALLAIAVVFVPNLSAPANAQEQALPDVANLADRVLPAVVEIAVESKVKGAAETLPKLPEDSPFKDFFDDFLNRKQDGQQNRQVSGMGSGFIIDSAGYVVTNNHVIDGADKIEVHMQDSTIFTAVLVGRDAKTDLAVLKIKSEKPLPFLGFGDSNSLRIGQWVMAIGNPFGLGGSVSLGIVSARNRDINAGPYDDFIQTDAAINKGNSGGPLFNLKGEVVGVNTAIFSPTGGSVGIGFSVPSNTVKSVVGQLVKFGETRRGWLGVKLQAMTDDIAASLNAKGIQGALIADVTEGGPSAKAGLLAGDVITEFDGKPIVEMRALPRAVGETDVGKKVEIKISRKGEQKTLIVELGRLEDGEKVAAAAVKPDMKPVSVAAIGLTLSSITDELRLKYKTDSSLDAVLITEVAKDSVSAEKRLEPGDVIVEAGGKRVIAPAEVLAAVEGAQKSGKSSVLLLVAKGGKAGETRFIALKLKK